MSNYLFCAGGSGARMLEPLVHLCAAGLGPDEVKVLVIDPDAGGGNLGVTTNAISEYGACQRKLGGKIGKDGSSEERFFRTRIRLLARAEGHGEGSWTPVVSGQHFYDVLGYEHLDDDQKAVANLLFSEDERNMQMNIGFQGHPSIGAGALSLLQLMEGNTPWSNPNPADPGIVQQLAADLAGGGRVRVVLAGSVFGGTGASAFFPLALWLKSVAERHPGGNIDIAVVALSPYFTFPPAPPAAAPRPGERPKSQVGPDARKFAHATRTAAQFYHQMRKQNHWPFAAMYWLGDDTPIQMNRNDGGPGQKNPPHFIELLAAQTALDFFADGPNSGLCYYSGTAGDAPNQIGWGDIPRIPRGASLRMRRQILKFLLAGMMHTDFYLPLIVGTAGKPRMPRGTISWYDKFFLDKEIDLSMAPAHDSMKELATYYKTQLLWWSRLHGKRYEGRKELDGVEGLDGRVLLINRAAFQAGRDPETGKDRIFLDHTRMRNLVDPDDPQQHGEGETLMHRFSFDRIPAGAQDGAPTYLAILTHAAEKFVDRFYGLN